MFNFGNTNTNTNTNTNAGNAATVGFSFGQANNNNNTSAAGGGLFGAKPTAPSGGLFGSAGTGAANATAQPSGGLFGAAGTSTAPGAATGGLFGAKPATAQPSGGLFGATGTSTAPGAATGGLFGAKPATTTTTSGLFGNSSTTSNTTAPTGGLFGSTTSTNTTTPAGSLFSAKPATTGGLFGSTNITSQPSGGLFGGQTQQQPLQTQQPSLFGTSTVKSTQPSFAWTEQTQNNQTMAQPQQVQQQLQQQQLLQQQQQQFQNSNYPQQIQEQIIKCKELWDPNNNKSKLKSFVYNKVNGTEAILYNKPKNVIQEDWDIAIENKPSKDVIPLQILGYDGLNQRNQLQRENVAQARVIFNQLLEKSTQLQQKHELNTSSRILKAQSRNSEIEKRILKLGSQLAILKSRGLPLNVNEEKMWNQFQALLKRSENPAGLGKTNELWARLAVLKERARSISEQLDSTLTVINENGVNPMNNNDSLMEDDVENRIDKIAEILSNQQRGIIYLNNVLVKDHSTIDKLKTK